MTEPVLQTRGPGAMLRAAREAQGLHIAALAAAIKVSPRKLDALENDRWHELPDATFTRALAQTVCRSLKLDSRPILDQLPSAAPVVLATNDAGLNEPFRDRPGREGPSIVAGAVRPMVWGAAVIILASVLVYVLPPNLWAWLPFGQSVAPKVAKEVAAVAPYVPPAAATSEPTSSLTSTQPTPAPARPPSELAGETVFSVPAAQSAPSAAALPVAGAASGLVQLRTSDASWIDVRDGRGATLLSRTVLPGESVGLDGRLPIRLTIGNAAATQLGFRGQTVDLTSRTRDNVAHVELE